MATLRSCIRSLLLLFAMCAALPAWAQDPPAETAYRYRIDIPESLIRNPGEAPQACTGRADDPFRVRVAGPAKSRHDSAWVRVVRVDGTTVTAVKPPANIDVYLGAVRTTLTTVMDSVVLTAEPRKLPGQRVIVQLPNTARPVCSLTLPGPVDAAVALLPQATRRNAEAVVSIGGSFDLLDGMRPTDLYSDARVFAPGLWEKWGVQAGIYQGRESAKGTVTGDTAAGRITYQRPVLPLDTAGGLLVVHQNFLRRESRSQNTLGLYMGVNRDIGRDIFGVALLEIRRENFRESYEDTLISEDTVRLRRGQAPLAGTVPGSRRTSGVRYEPAFMVGPRLDMRRESFNLILQPLVGATRGYRCSRATTTSPPECKAHLSLVQWDVTFELEAAKSGIKLGGEVRGFQAQTPSILVYLAKEFSIEKFADFLVGPKQ